MSVIPSLQRLTTTQALEILEGQYGIKITIPTLIKWTREYGLGVKLAGQWWINAEKLGIFIEQGSIKENEIT